MSSAALVWRRYLPDAPSTEALGGELARVLQPGELLVLTGPLGAGKTTLVRGLLHGLGSAAHVRSASFAWVQEYAGEPRVTHYDFYRLEDPSQLEALGWEDALGSGGLIVAEWGERAGEALPDERWELTLRPQGDGREATLEARGERLTARAPADRAQA